MTDHVHWDVDAAERAMRDALLDTQKQRDQMVADGKADKAFMAAQAMFDEPRLQFLLSCLRAENAGIGRNELLSGAGYTMGTIWGSMLQSTVGARERAVFNGWVHQALASAIGAAPAEKTLTNMFVPMEAGHA